MFITKDEQYIYVIYNSFFFLFLLNFSVLAQQVKLNQYINKSLMVELAKCNTQLVSFSKFPSLKVLCNVTGRCFLD